MRWVPPGFGPFESYEADHTVSGGERLTLADLDIEVIFTPGHSPGHVTYCDPRSAPLRATCSSRAPSGAWTCPAVTGRRSSARSRACSPRYPAETIVYPGHMGVTTLGRERETNPFLTRDPRPHLESGGADSAPER